MLVKQILCNMGPREVFWKVGCNEIRQWLQHVVVPLVPAVFFCLLPSFYVCILCKYIYLVFSQSTQRSCLLLLSVCFFPPNLEVSSCSFCLKVPADRRRRLWNLCLSTNLCPAWFFTVRCVSCQKIIWAFPHQCLLPWYALHWFFRLMKLTVCSSAAASKA